MFIIFFHCLLFFSYPFLLFAVCFFVVYSCYDAINSFLFFGGESSLLSQIYIHIFCLSVCVCVCVFFIFYFHFAFWLSWTILPNCSLYVLRHYNEKGKNKHSFYHLVCPTSCLYFFLFLFVHFHTFWLVSAVTDIGNSHEHTSGYASCLSFYHSKSKWLLSLWLESINNRKTHKEIYICY